MIKPGFFLLMFMAFFLNPCFGYKVHFHNPWARDTARIGDALVIRGNPSLGLGYHPGDKMLKEPEGDWYMWEFTKIPNTPDSLKAKGPSFVFVSAVPPHYNNPMFFDSTGITPKSAQAKWFNYWDVFQIESDHPIQEAWIYLDSGQVVIANQPMTSKVLYLFNPWPVTAPLMSVNGGEYEGMRVAKDKNGQSMCGWFLEYISGNETTYLVHFKEIISKQEIWGINGLGSADPIDLTSVFTTNDTAYLIPAPPPTLSTSAGTPSIQVTKPENITGPCVNKLTFLIRDFSATHPDFMKPGELVGGLSIEGLVEKNLSPERKPVRSGKAHPKITKFEEWFSDVPGVNFTSRLDLPLTKSPDGYWRFDSYYTTHTGVEPNPYFQFFPLDDDNKHGDELWPAVIQGKVGENYVNTKWTIDPTLHNFHFCMETHTKFQYLPGQVFKISGDDDIWVYINEHLVIDFGSVHAAASGSIIMDSIAKFQNVNPGDDMLFDLFYCERLPGGSNLFIKAPVYFEQDPDSFVKPIPSDVAMSKAEGLIMYSGQEVSLLFDLDEQREGTISIYDLKGKTVLMGYLNEGHGGRFIWNGEDKFNHIVKSGLYLYRFSN